MSVCECVCVSVCVSIFLKFRFVCDVKVCDCMAIFLHKSSQGEVKEILGLGSFHPFMDPKFAYNSKLNTYGVAGEILCKHFERLEI